MKKRIITALVMVVLFVPLIIFESKFTRIAYFCVAAFFSGVASFEVLSSMYKESPELKVYRFIVPPLAAIVCGTLMYATHLSSQVTEEGISHFAFTSGVINQVSGSDYMLVSSLIWFFIALIVFALSTLLVFGLMIFTKNSQARAMMGCLLALSYGGLLLGFTFSLRYFKPNTLNEHSIFNIVGIKSFIYVYTIVATTDIFAYFMGSKFGKRKLCPNISPNKSVEGALFGLLFGTLFGVAIFLLTKMITPSNTLEWILGIVGAVLVSASISVFVQIGDLVESKLKRSFDVKDFGNIFPGHGGVLDRFDSFLYAGAWFYLLIQIVQIIIFWSH